MLSFASIRTEYGVLRRDGRKKREADVEDGREGLEAHGSLAFPVPVDESIFRESAIVQSRAIASKSDLQQPSSQLLAQIADEKVSTFGNLHFQHRSSNRSDALVHLELSRRRCTQ